METWEKIISQEMKEPYFIDLQEKVAHARCESTVYPPEEKVYTALELTPLEHVKVVILGQDPYHGPHQAHGLSFSIESKEAKFPPSLRNILQELETDLGIKRMNNNLTDWAEQGVLLLNTVFTVEAGRAGSHQKWGWELLTEKLLLAVTQLQTPIVYILWGAHAQKYAPLITQPHHFVIQAPHPSPLSSYRGFFGSKPFSQTNDFLEKNGISPIAW